MPDILDDYRAKFWQITDKLAAHDAAVAPLRAKRDALNVHLDAARALDNELRAENAKRAPIAQELALLAKALGGNTGERPAKA